MERLHGGDDRDRDDDKRDDLERLDAVDTKRAAGREKVQIYEKEGCDCRQYGWAGPTIPGGDSHCWNEEQKARRGSVAPEDQGRDERDRGDDQRQRVSRE